MLVVVLGTRRWSGGVVRRGRGRGRGHGQRHSDSASCLHLPCCSLLPTLLAATVAVTTHPPSHRCLCLPSREDDGVPLALLRLSQPTP